jgi:hypothetical protein
MAFILTLVSFVKIPRSCTPKIVSVAFILDCLDLNRFLYPDAYVIPMEELATDPVDDSGSWLRIDSLAKAEEAEQREAELKALHEAQELAARRRELQTHAAQEPPPVKRIVMGRNGQIKYIYKDNKQICVQPTRDDHLLTQVTAKAHTERATIDGSILEEKQKKQAEKKRLKKQKQKLARQMLQSTENNASRVPSGSLMWAFSVFADPKAPHSVLGIEADSTNTRGMGPFRVKSAGIMSAVAVSVGPSHSAALDGMPFGFCSC